MSGNAGGELFAGNSGLLTGPLGVVKIGFNGYDLGFTTSDSMLDLAQTIKDILYQQEGTQASDHVRTGLEYELKATFGEINTGILKELLSGFSSDNSDPLDDSGEFGRCLYESMRETEAKTLRVVSVDCNGIPSEEDRDTLNFYTAIPILDGTILNWGADTQRNVSVTFKIKYHVFDEGESVSKKGSFGYYGDPTALDVPPADWPDVSAPSVQSATVTSMTMTIDFGEIVTEVSGVSVEERAAVFVNGGLVAPTSGTTSGNTAVLMFAADTFTAGDVISFSMSADTLENAESISNDAINNYSVDNPL